MITVLAFPGQVRGGKNHVNITRTGHRYPNVAWAEWRDEMVARVRLQRNGGAWPLTGPLHLSCDYFPGDNRRRDIPAVLDALFHVCEHAGVVADDVQFKDVHFRTMPVSKDPHALVRISSLQ